MFEEIAEPLKKQIDDGIKILKQGGIVAFPTDTVYCLGASIFDVNAVRRVFEVKQRPFNMALPVIMTNVAQINDVGISLPDNALRLAQKFWPGALTLVIYKSNKVSDIVTAKKNTIAVRIPAHQIPIALINGLGVPTTGTSANVHEKPSPVTAAEVRSQLGDKVDLIIDGGQCPGGEASTIVDMTGEQPVILREGPIPFHEIMRFYKMI
ncbi:MAG: threonylcarbamoyl-AMP synthase [Dehalococcoidales bacterium]|nr:threonylcarbamoyl-AMP synthase [Dehalococcoidales bacterium]